MLKYNNIYSKQIVTKKIYTSKRKPIAYFLKYFILTNLILSCCYGISVWNYFNVTKEYTYLCYLPQQAYITHNN